MTPTATSAPTGVSRVISAWNRFFFVQGPILSLGVFRIVFAFCLFFEVETTRAHSRFAIEGGFHIPYLSFIGQVSEPTYHLLHNLQYPFIVLLGLGLFSRACCGALLLLQGFVYFNDLQNFRNHPYLFLLLLLLLLFSPAANAVSVSAMGRALFQRRSVITALVEQRDSLTCQRLMQIQICLVYLVAGLHKCTPFFFSGKVLAYFLNQSVEHWRPYLDFFFATATADQLQAKLLSPQVQMWPSIMTVVMELGLPFALWHRRTRRWAMILGIFFHLGIGVLMNITTFSAAMIGSYLLFLDPETLPRLARRVIGDHRGETSPPTSRAERRRAMRQRRKEAAAARRREPRRGRRGYT